MNQEKYTDRMRGFLQSAQTLAQRSGHQRLAPEHQPGGRDAGGAWVEWRVAAAPTGGIGRFRVGGIVT